MSNTKSAAPKAAAATNKSNPNNLSGEQIAEMREGGMTWAQIAEEAGLEKGQTIIPLRNLMYKAQGKTIKAKSKAALGKEVLKMRDAGGGWPRIAAATGLSIKDARAAYTEAGGTNPDGRVYVKGATKEGESATVTVRTESTHAGQEAEGATEAEQQPAA